MSKARKRWDGRPSRFLRRLSVESRLLSETYREACLPLKLIPWALVLTLYRVLGLPMTDAIRWLPLIGPP